MVIVIPTRMTFILQIIYNKNYTNTFITGLRYTDIRADMRITTGLPDTYTYMGSSGIYSRVYPYRALWNTL